MKYLILFLTLFSMSAFGADIRVDSKGDAYIKQSGKPNSKVLNERSDGKIYDNPTFNGNVRVDGGTYDFEMEGPARRKFIGGASNELELGTYSGSGTSRDVQVSIDSAGHMSFVNPTQNGIIFTNGGGSTLDWYEEHDATTALSGGSGAGSTVRIKAIRIGDSVTMTVKFTSATGTTNNMFVTAATSGLPSSFYPSSEITAHRLVDTANDVGSYVTVTATGLVAVYNYRWQDAADTIVTQNFTDSTAHVFTIAYTIGI